VIPLFKEKVMPIASTIPAPTDIAATDRKEAAIDTEVICGLGNQPPSQYISLYANPKQFTNTSGQNNIETKQPDRDNNLGGPGAGLPTGTMLSWFAMRFQILTYTANLNLGQNNGVLEQISRLRECGNIEAKFSRTPLFIAPLGDLVSFMDARYSTTSFAGLGLTPTISTRDGKSVTTDEKPFVILGQEWAEINMKFSNLNSFTGPQNANTVFTAICPFYGRSFLDGILSIAD
jgi:hypothetical protein